MTWTSDERIDDAANQILEDVRRVATEIMRGDFMDGGDGYRAVRLGVDGVPRAIYETSRLIPESEYYAKSPHPLTIWEAPDHCDRAEPELGLFEWEATPDGEYVGNFATGDYSEFADLELDGRPIPNGWVRFDLDFDKELDDLLGEDCFNDDDIRERIRDWIVAGNLDDDYLEPEDDDEDGDNDDA